MPKFHPDLPHVHYFYPTVRKFGGEVDLESQMNSFKNNTLSLTSTKFTKKSSCILL